MADQFISELPVVNSAVAGDFLIINKSNTDTRRIDISNLNLGSSYTLPTASATTKGGVKIGTGLSMSGDTLNATGGSNYTLPTASSSVLGGVKVGARLSISNGTLSADIQSGSGGGATELNDLSDVSISNPQEGEVLKYILGQWIPSFDSTGGGSVDYATREVAGTTRPGWGLEMTPPAANGTTYDGQIRISGSFLANGCVNLTSNQLSIGGYKNFTKALYLDGDSTGGSASLPLFKLGMPGSQDIAFNFYIETDRGLHCTSDGSVMFKLYPTKTGSNVGSVVIQNTLGPGGYGLPVYTTVDEARNDRDLRMFALYRLGPTKFRWEGHEVKQKDYGRTTYADGTEEVLAADGTHTFTFADGAVLTRVHNADGSEVDTMINSDGSQGPITTHAANGEDDTLEPDGSHVLVHPDGTVDYTDAAGNITMHIDEYGVITNGPPPADPQPPVDDPDEPAPTPENS